MSDFKSDAEIRRVAHQNPGLIAAEVIDLRRENAALRDMLKACVDQGSAVMFFNTPAYQKAEEFFFAEEEKARTLLAGAEHD